MIEDFIAQMWCSTSEEAVPKDIAAAQRDAVLDSVDFKFVTGIAMEQQNIERNPSNADSIETYFKKDIDKKFGKLSPVKKAMCRLDWYAVLYRMLSYISTIKGVFRDQKALLFVQTLGLSEKWKEEADLYRKNAAELTESTRASFAAWLRDTEEELVHPMNALWDKKLHAGSIRRGISRAVKTVIALLILLTAGSYLTGVGYVAKITHHERIAVLPKEQIEGFGTYPEVGIEDYNASTNLTEGLDRALMDKDPKTAWTEGEKDAGIGRKLYFNPEDTQEVHYIVIYNGNQKDSASFKKDNRLKEITLKLDDSQHEKMLTLKDEEGPQYIRVNRKVGRFWIIIDSVYEGTDKANLTSVSEVEIY